MKRFHTILHPTDFSVGSNVAFQYACDLARDYDIPLVIISVIQPVVTRGIAMEGIVLPYDFTELEAAAQKELDELQPVGPGVRVEKWLRQGPPASTIVEAANERKVDLIVMGTHGRTGIGRLLIGSVAEEVIRKAHCPVLTVKAPEPAK